jgi:hypothetical protein
MQQAANPFSKRAVKKPSVDYPRIIAYPSVPLVS